MPLSARWTQNGITITGGHGIGNASNQLYYPYGLYVDDDQTVVIADQCNHRIVEWKPNATSIQVVAGGNGQGNRTDQLSRPLSVIVDKETDSLIICDTGNRRVMRWSRRSRTSGETIIDNIDCYSLTMDDERFLYICEYEKDQVRRMGRMGDVDRVGETNGKVVAGGNGKGDRLDQLNSPRCVFVDRNHSVYVLDGNNHRVMKWVKGATEGIVAAGGRGKGSFLTQLSTANGVFVDPLGTLYVADSENHRVVRWCNGATQGNVIVGGNGEGQEANQFNCPMALSFDRHGNLYVVDWLNHRVQRFSTEAS
ncbi:unnamed protein product [Didymodactylos carnosus]|uniref:NHL repeat-containing protein n=1 Tax=Didymodactylos carnosus TaxID=1234261 RepID=A0A814TKD7_9BILA|nr:unnamed protein product [Didymodactylos carnosus]CAF1162015.1 unnamed protein product [Didymodactylos carnosus]CAF3739101.1 unnamed protein product [Didymodactylos carnosus]CAF3925623.1 unnamed protein product [Didymodactylos carnosus]